MKGMRIALVWVASGLIGIFLNCGVSTVITYRDGRLYVVNNTNLESNLGGFEYILVEWEGEEIKIPRNMNPDGSWTHAGAVQLTPEPLPGGTGIDFTYHYFFVGASQPVRLSGVLKVLGEEAIIDGDITIDIYSRVWEPGHVTNIMAYAGVVKGEFDGPHSYPELRGGR